MADSNLTKARDLETIDLLCQRTKQLTAMLRMAHGESGEALRNKSDAIQDAYFWSCADMAEELSGLAETL